MLRFLKVAVVAVPAALTVMAPIEARANPMVAVGWLWAAGAGGVILGALGTVLYNQNRIAVVAPAYAQAPIVDPYANCRRVQARYQGRWRQVIVCD
jgi:hypothetical protein